MNILTYSPSKGSSAIAIVVLDIIGHPRAMREVDGKKIYDLMAPALKEGKKVILDFRGLGKLTWSFITKSIGQLYQEGFSDEEIDAQLSLTNIEPDQVEFIQEVVETKKAYLKDPEQFKKPMSDERLAELRRKNPGNFWFELAGKYKDDPLFDDMLVYIEEYRREQDAEMEEYYRQLDEEDAAK